MLLFLLLIIFFFYVFSIFSMTIDVLPQEFLLNSSCVPPSQQICVYPMENRCPCFQFQKAPEPSPEVLEELQYQKEIQTIRNSTQKLVFELQHSKMKLALLKITNEIEKISRQPIVVHIQEEPESEEDKPEPETEPKLESEPEI